MSTTRSVHFPPAPKHESQKSAERKDQINSIELFANALRDSEFIRERLRGLLVSANRHGDLQACRTAALRLVEQLARLIEIEEG